MAIDYDRWIKDTSRIGLTRSPELKAVDAAFLTFAKLGTADAKQALERAFDAWKRKEGPGDAWRRSARNRSRAADKLAALLSGHGDDDTAFSMGRTPEFMHEELINARLGVLYLFSRLSVAPGIFKMVLEGGLDIAGQALEIGNASETAQSVVGKIEKGSSVLGKIGDKVEGKLVPTNTPKNVYLPQGAAPSVMAGPRATTVTAEQIQREADAAQALASRPFVSKIKDKVQEWFDQLVQKMLELLRQKFGTIEGVAGTLKQVVKGIVTLVAAKAAPFVGAGLEIASAIGKTVDASVTRFRAWKDSRGVELGDGHPATVVESITRAMTLSLFQGLWDMLKGASSLAMDIVGFGAGGVVNLVISASEMLIKFIWRLVETVRINAFCREARGHWEQSQSLDGLHRRPFAFSEWYRGYALNLPLISVLTLNTGICGDKMRYLSMFSAGGRLISSDHFLHGARYLDSLKPWGAKYLDDAGFSIRSGGDVLVDQLVNTFALSHERERTVFDKVIAVVTA